MQLWHTYSVSRQYRTRPSELVGLTDTYAAWCFDEVVYLFGTYVESELRAAEEGAKTAKQAANKRKLKIHMLLEPRPTDFPVDETGPEDDLAREQREMEEKLGRKLPTPRRAPAKFADPAGLFKNKKTATKKA